MLHRTSLPNVLELMTARWKGYRERARTRSELALISPHEVDALATDCGLSPSQFLDVVNRVHHAADELGSVAAVLDIDAEKLPKRVFNDMRRVCADCRSKSACRRSIQQGTIATDHVAFCNNSEVLAELRKRSIAVAI